MRSARATRLLAVLSAFAVSAACGEGGGGGDMDAGIDSGGDSGGDSSVVVAATGVTLDRETLTFTVGGAPVMLVATVAPSNATDASVTWSSSDMSVATVSATGLVTPVAVGTATITVTTVSGGFTDTWSSSDIAVTVAPISVTGVSLNMPTLRMMTGAMATLVPTVAPANASNPAVTWMSSSSSVATVSSSGVVTAAGPGTATITVTTADGNHTAMSEVTVRDVLATGVSLSADTLTMTYGGPTQALTAMVAPGTADEQDVTWSSSNESAATVSATGVVTAVGSGTTTITVTTVDGAFTDTCAVTVSPDVVTSVASVTPLTGQMIVTWTDALDPNATGVEVSMTSSGTNLPMQTVASGVERVVLSGLSFPVEYTVSLRVLGPSSTTSNVVQHVNTTTQVVYLVRNSLNDGICGAGECILADTNGTGGVETHDTVILNRADGNRPRTYRWVFWPGLTNPTDSTLVSLENQVYSGSQWVSNGRYLTATTNPWTNSGQFFSWCGPNPNMNIVFAELSPPAASATFRMSPAGAPNSVRFRPVSDETTALLHNCYHVATLTPEAAGAAFDADSSWFLEPTSFSNP